MKEVPSFWNQFSFRRQTPVHMVPVHPCFVGLFLQGMCFLHKSSIGCHGDLRSSKCVIDSRWVCKITDVGLGKFKGGQKPNSYIGLDGEYNRK